MSSVAINYNPSLIALGFTRPMEEFSGSHHQRNPPGHITRGIFQVTLPGGFLPWCDLPGRFIYGVTYPEVSSGDATYGGF